MRQSEVGKITSDLKTELILVGNAFIMLNEHREKQKQAKGNGGQRCLNTALVACVSLLLSGCCIFGFQSTKELVWEQTDPGLEKKPPFEAERLCAAEASDKCKDNRIRSCKMLIENPSEIRIVNPSTGVVYVDSDPSIIKEYVEDCKATLRQPAKLDFWCSFGLVSKIDECMRKSGFSQVSRESISCKSMRLF